MPCTTVPTPTSMPVGTTRSTAWTRPMRRQNAAATSRWFTPMIRIWLRSASMSSMPASPGHGLTSR